MDAQSVLPGLHRARWHRSCAARRRHDGGLNAVRVRPSGLLQRRREQPRHGRLRPAMSFLLLSRSRPGRDRSDRHPCLVAILGYLSMRIGPSALAGAHADADLPVHDTVPVRKSSPCLTQLFRFLRRRSCSPSFSPCAVHPATVSPSRTTPSAFSWASGTSSTAAVRTWSLRSQTWRESLSVLVDSFRCQGSDCQGPRSPA
jgi:hypothetical protein